MGHGGPRSCHPLRRNEAFVAMPSETPDRNVGPALPDRVTPAPSPASDTQASSAATEATAGGTTPFSLPTGGREEISSADWVMAEMVDTEPSAAKPIYDGSTFHDGAGRSPFAEASAGIPGPTGERGTAIYSGPVSPVPQPGLASAETSHPMQPRRPWRPQPGLGLAFFLTWVPLIVQVLVGVGVSIGVMVLFGAMQRNVNDATAWLQANQASLLPVGTLTTLFVALAIAFLFYGRAMVRCIAFRGLHPLQLLATLMLVVPLATLASELTNLASLVVPVFEPMFLRAFREANQQMFAQAIETSWLLVFIGGCVLPGIGEEIFSRGFIGRGLVSRYGIVLGVTFSSFLFGAMHLDPIQATGAMALGFGLHFVYLCSRSLWAPIVLHILNNAFAFWLWSWSESIWIPGLSNGLNEQLTHTPALVLLAAAATASVWCWFLYRFRTHWQMPAGEIWNPGFPTAEMPPAALGCQAVQQPLPWSLLGLGLLSTLLLLGALFASADILSST